MLLPSRVSLLEDPKNCPRKYLKIFSTEFIFRRQKILLTIDVIERYRSLADWSRTKYVKFVWLFLFFFHLLSLSVLKFNLSLRKSQFFTSILHSKFYPVLTNFMANFNLFVYMWASNLNFFLSLVGYSAQQTLGVIACPSLTELSSFRILKLKKNQTSARFALVFCISFSWPRNTKRSKHLCTKTVCLWPRFVICHCNMYCNLLTK